MPTAIYPQTVGRRAGKPSVMPRTRGVVDVTERRLVEKGYEKLKTKISILPKTAIYPRWWKEVKRAGINFATIATHIVIPAEIGIRHFISLITFTVGGETNITLYDGDFPFSGPMDFGGTNEPRGIVISLADAPLMLGKDAAFRIASTGAVQVSGFVTYMSEIAEPPPEMP